MTDTAHKYGFEMLYERERETTARLRALNAELIAALLDAMPILERGAVTMLAGIGIGEDAERKADGAIAIVETARAAIAKARGGAE
jgi:hypothetical protein